VKRLLRWLAAAILVGFVTTSLLAADAAVASRREPDPVVDCPPRLVCFTIAEGAEIDRALLDLQTELSLIRLKRLRRFGWTAGCGGGVAWDALDGQYVIAPLCAATWGLRF
jgi:hypothetical protein